MLLFIPKTSSLIILGILLLITSCAPSPSDRNAQSNSQTNSESATAELFEDPTVESTTESELNKSETETAENSQTKAAASDPASSAGIIEIFTVDSLCEDFVPQTVNVLDTNSLDAAVGKVLNARGSATFSISAYRVNYSPENREATIDFQLPEDTERRFQSLSSCEQQSLFGSLRETLTRNPAWAVDTVRFTNQGKELLL